MAFPRFIDNLKNSLENSDPVNTRWLVGGAVACVAGYVVASLYGAGAIFDAYHGRADAATYEAMVFAASVSAGVLGDVACRSLVQSDHSSSETSQSGQQRPEIVE